MGSIWMRMQSPAALDSVSSSGASCNAYQRGIYSSARPYWSRAATHQPLRWSTARQIDGWCFPQATIEGRRKALGRADRKSSGPNPSLTVAEAWSQTTPSFTAPYALCIIIHVWSRTVIRHGITSSVDKLARTLTWAGLKSLCRCMRYMRTNTGHVLIQQKESFLHFFFFKCHNNSNIIIIIQTLLNWRLD